MLVLGIALVRAQAPSTRYIVQVLGELPRIAAEVRLGMNSRGEVAGWERGPDGRIRGIVWRGGRRVAVAEPAGVKSWVCVSINDKGDIAGWGRDSENITDSRHPPLAFVWPHKTGVSQRRPEPLNQAMAHAISSEGAVVGGVLSNSRRAWRGLYWERDTISESEPLPGGSYSVVRAINARREMAGASNTPSGVNHACIWIQGNPRDLGVPQGGARSYALGINDQSQVVGFAEIDGDTEAMLWDAGKTTRLGNLGDDPSMAMAINNRGQIVGLSGMGRERIHAFLWERGRMQDLNSLIPASSAWTLTEGHAINDRGQIACAARTADGRQLAVLLSPAEPVPARPRTRNSAPKRLNHN